MGQLDLLWGSWGSGLGLDGPRSGNPVACPGVLEAVPLLPLCPPQASSFSSVTDSTMSLNIITVTLNMGMEGLGGSGL